LNKAQKIKQENLNSTEQKYIYYYTAGILDSCGNITIRKDNKSKNSIFAYVEIKSEKETNLKLIQKIFGGNIRKIGNKYYLIWTHRKALNFIKEVIDYLIIKKEEAELIIQLYSNRFTRKYETQRKKEIVKKLFEIKNFKPHKWESGKSSIQKWLKEE
jgi:hypothetical protein